MDLEPGYGETPLPDDDLEGLTPLASDLLGAPISRASVYDLEQAVQEQVTADLLTDVFCNALLLEDLLTDHFLRGLHRRLYADIWIWAGLFRGRELNIGIAPEAIAYSLRAAPENIRYRWKHTEDWSARELGMAVHAEVVRIHPFSDGNGRTTRLLADITFVAAQESASPHLYDWNLEKTKYIALLRNYDSHRDSRDLAAFVGTKRIGE